MDEDKKFVGKEFEEITDNNDILYPLGLSNTIISIVEMKYMGKKKEE